MDQNQNNDLFEFDNSQSQPPSQGSTPPPTGGARVYGTPEGAQPAEPGYTTPAPPPYTPPPSTTPPAQTSNRNRTIWIVVIVAVVLLCCCLIALILVVLAFINYMPIDISMQPLSLLQRF